ELGRVQIAESSTPPRELLLHPQGRLAHLGVGLGRSAQDQTLVAAGQAVLVVGVVQAKADQGGTESAGPGGGLLHQRHRVVGLSRGGCRNRLARRARRPSTRQRIRPGRLASRLSYRILPSPRTAPLVRIPPVRRTRSATVLRSTQAFFRDRAGHAIGGPDRDPARLHLLLAEEPALA